MTRRMHSTSDRTLGVEVESRELGYYWRLCKPAPETNWSGPYDSSEGAHSAAIRTLLLYARYGKQAADNMVEDDETAVDITVPEAWWRAFGSEA